jgi:hypothetical protein
MISLWMVHDGFVHGRWSMVDLHIGGVLLSGNLTLVACLIDIIP